MSNLAGNGQLASIQVQTPDLTGWLCMENRPLPITEIDVLQILPRRPAHQDPARELAYLLAR